MKNIWIQFLTIKHKVEDVSFKRNAENYLKILKPISKSLDIIQDGTCTIAECVNIWKILFDEFKDQPIEIREK